LDEPTLTYEKVCLREIRVEQHSLAISENDRRTRSISAVLPPMGWMIAPLFYAAFALGYVGCHRSEPSVVSMLQFVAT
jgi:hypothetical protein